MLVNRLQRVGCVCVLACFRVVLTLRPRTPQDLQSANILEISAALSATCKLLTADMIPAVLPLVLELMKHEQFVHFSVCVPSLPIATPIVRVYRSCAGTLSARRA
jgi:hypothetical protein